MSANDMQIGGSHYAMEYQHWDFVYDAGLDYLAGCASKYPTRWRSKNGAEDLTKCVHYIEKMQERRAQGLTVKRRRSPTEQEAITKFINQLDIDSAALVALIAHGHLKKAKRQAEAMLAELGAATEQPPKQ